MTNANITRIVNAYRLYEASNKSMSFEDIATHFSYSESAQKQIKATFNRFTSIDANASDIQDYFNGDFLVSIKALEFAIRFDCKQKEIHGHELAEQLNCQHDFIKFQCMLRGLSVTYPESFNYSDTHGFDTLKIK